jgi:secondary thiamine-phosphate synthase enzyme
MRQTLALLSFETPGRGMVEITPDIQSWVRQTGARLGTLTLFCQHTSASLLITENASPAVQRDLIRWFDAAAPEGPGYEHALEGPDDMPAHIKAALTGNSLTIPVADGRLLLGTWQGIFLAEHRNEPQGRTLVAHIMAE